MADQINCKKSIALVMAGLIANVSAASINGMNSNANNNAFMKSNNGQVNTQAIYSAVSQKARNYGQQKKFEMQSQMNSKMSSGNTQASMVLTAPNSSGNFGNSQTNSGSSLFMNNGNKNNGANQFTSPAKSMFGNPNAATQFTQTNNTPTILSRNSSINKNTGIQAGTATYNSNSNLRNTGSFGNNAFSQFSNNNQAQNKAPNTASNYGLSGQNGTYRPQQQQYQLSRSQSAGYGQIASNYQAPQKAQQGQQGLRTQSTSQVQAYLQKNVSSSSASTLKSTKAA